MSGPHIRTDGEVGRPLVWKTTGQAGEGEACLEQWARAHILCMYSHTHINSLTHSSSCALIRLHVNAPALFSPAQPSLLYLPDLCHVGPRRLFVMEFIGLRGIALNRLI